ncbi:conserved hypothetical protein [Vibrio crassostreae]|nr:conserved hypothetical protein [Vibrio crassostreae]
MASSSTPFHECRTYYLKSGKMKIITQFNELDSLPLPEVTIAALRYHMTEPFEFDDVITTEFWQEVSTSLILIEESDTDETISQQPESVQHLIRFVQNYPETVYLINSIDTGFIIALAIITSAGGGVYLVSPTSNTSHPVRILLPHAESL